MLKIKDLSFSYGKNEVFRDFNLEIPEGEVCLITGINGVGKSTLLRLIMGVLNPDAGDIVFDEKMGDDPRRKIGFISDILSLYENLKVSQAIEFHKSIYGLSRFDNSLIHHAKIDLKQKIKELSTGQRTILHLSLILSIEPEIFLIDEVIHSIDAYLRKLFIEELIQLLSQRKITVIMVNLNFHDIEHIVERVILLKAGKIVVDEKIEALKAKIKRIISIRPPESLNILSKVEYSDHSEFYVYPYSSDCNLQDKSKVEDLNLTEIVTAFIGGEYA